ncbi:hypothetical protein DWB61_11340 [Ancylomarina euxinus]|uniref:Uncharacterized protein n=1 Tax=Ancylomarina euxinus TaxID=2283627 RepID=A0A425XZW4_9BACT|nr:hypothetical protein [Ancylomarina euxinus]MCZ4695353.1 hypothetical protein [Ancylomarina euxinus]MUP15549.1 hypothetical protein [Ancylomarina euxinus]RRG21006.1 hypothetical protein DWB61_11340 [Ancylomarina euxinus]
MKQEEKYSSLRDSTYESVGNFLFAERFNPCEKTQEGILEVINLISDYYEEGVHLYPEVIITNSLTFFKTISNREVIIDNKPLEVDEFKNAIKLCAPLAINNWIIFIEVNGENVKYGLVSAEMTETSPSIYEQTVGKLGIELEGVKDKDLEKTTIAYIRNIGSKTVELTGLKKKLTISLTLDKPLEVSNNEIGDIAILATKLCDSDYTTHITSFLEKTINEAIKIGHGNLIGIVEDSEVAISKIKEELNDCTYLEKPIDIVELVSQAEIEKTNESSVTLKAHSSLLISMLNHDGITVLTNKCRIIGYHMFIKDIKKDGVQLVGGARTRAFHSMVNSKLFKACFYKSQDGNTKNWKEDE